MINISITKTAIALVGDEVTATAVGTFSYKKEGDNVVLVGAGDSEIVIEPSTVDQVATVALSPKTSTQLITVLNAVTLA
jgi:ribosomal protein L10